MPKLVVLLKEPTPHEADGTKPFDRSLDPAIMAAVALGRIVPDSAQAREVVLPLADLLRSEDSWRRDAAAGTLCRLGPTAIDAAPALVAALREAYAQKNTTIYGTDVAIALGRVAPGSPVADDAVAILIDVLDIDWEPTRANAIDALGRFGAVARPAIPRLRALLDDPVPSVRQNASSSLRMIER